MCMHANFFTISHTADENPWIESITWMITVFKSAQMTITPQFKVFYPQTRLLPHIITHWIVEYAWYAIKKASIHISCIHKNVEHVVTRFNDNVMFPPLNTHLKARSLSVTTTTVAANAEQMSEWGRKNAFHMLLLCVCLYLAFIHKKNTFTM